MAKNKSDKKKKVTKGKTNVVTKQGLGMGVPVSSSPSNTPTPSPGQNYQTVSTNTSSSGGMYWPSPTAWYQMGKDATKKALLEYVNGAVQIQNETDEKRRLELASKMNLAIQSVIQGIAIATEAVELQSQRKRTGDQSAVFEISLTEDCLRRMLKMLWIHDLVAKKGTYPGLEIKLLDSQLTGRINRTTVITTNDDGLPLELDKGENPNDLWMTDYTPPAPGMEGPAGPTTPGVSEVPPGAALPPGAPPATAAPAPEVPPTAPVQETPPEQGGALPPAEAPIVEEQAATVEPQATSEVPESTPMTSGDGLGATPLPEGDISQREAAVAQREAAVAQREAAVAQREAALSQTSSLEVEEELPPEEIAVEEGGEEPPPEETDTEEGSDFPEEEGGEEPPPEETDTEEGSDFPEEEGEEGEEEETFYCEECDAEVTQGDIDTCTNENCPFKSAETSDQPTEPSTEEVAKSIAILNSDPHEGHRTYDITFKEYSGVTGNFCLDCQVLTKCYFDDSWSAGQIQDWVKKQLDHKHIVEKTPQDMVEKALDLVSEEEILSWIDERKGITEEKGIKDLLETEEFLSFMKEGITKSFEGVSDKFKTLG